MWRFLCNANSFSLGHSLVHTLQIWLLGFVFLTKVLDSSSFSVSLSILDLAQVSDVSSFIVDEFLKFVFSVDDKTDPNTLISTS